MSARSYDLAGRLIQNIETAKNYSTNVTTQTRTRLYYNQSGLLMVQYTDKSTDNGITWKPDSQARYSNSAAALYQEESQQ